MIDPDSGPSGKSRRQCEPQSDDVTAQMETILASADFAQSARLQKFLRFIVEETLSGRGAALKEYTIALDVFDRDESFDPQTSSIVRVEASRLRAKLERYNAVEGNSDAIRISLPSGGYEPEFQTTGPSSEPIARHPDTASLHDTRRLAPRRVVVPLALIIVAIGAAVFLFSDLLSFKSATDSPLQAARPMDTYSLAVLPLRDLSADGAETYFSDGMTDALITRLAKGGAVRVTAMTSVMQYKNVDRPVADIAGELGVSHIIEGSVLRIGDKVRIAAQLIEAESDRHVWADSYERNFADVLALQDEVVGNIVASLPGHVAPTSGMAATTLPAIDPAAYEANLRGRFFLNKMTEEGFRKGIAYFEQAIERAPAFAPAYSGMASCYCLLGGHGFEIVKPSVGMPAAKKAVLESLRLDDSLAEPYAFLGIIRLKYEWDWPGAEQAFKRSIALNPSYTQAHIFYSFFLEAMGQSEAAIREAEEARANDPLSLPANINLGWQYLQAGRPEQARQIFESTAELDANFWGIPWGLGHYYRRKGDFGEAIAAFQKSIAAGGGHALPLSAAGYTYAIAGDTEKATEMLDRLTALAEESYVSPFNMAIIHAGLGDKDEAFVWLEKAYAQRSRSMAWLNVTNELEGLRADPRFDSLLRRIGHSD